MQEEYALVLAQLRLAGEVDDFHLHGMSHSQDLSLPISRESGRGREIANVQDQALRQRKLLVYWSREDRSISPCLLLRHSRSI